MKYLAILIISAIPALLSAQYCDSFRLTLEDELELECTSNTIKDALDKASNPNRLVFGICWQHSVEDKWIEIMCTRQMPRED
ncbi:MAG: hypothetical protein P8I55_08500 [Crocinitomix sp.]|nr:hypothetical protein [Crocinitomix sp.]